ncbi:PD-(D/E)XK nuclease family transposase (plasmid) [Candidatus Trichorickettsia mobilis]|jgi:predicted transposase/invertase (TIGR01784 family)|uniref:PD-(D/E)XK nuclease family transposase n=1 Tax=Candidatus Trichorickettsia mobilis TaxID=1346319 RepID=A0ABZ0UVB2_9RICK|nr:Rpn family recombination-promoting nuclease/putative transposase [Candidatus Trichorickettsia mobilis]WPY01546.1 PD-(D/E)XK nuclease family transposase [Candidatus Trichorickettsia mobilis]
MKAEKLIQIEKGEEIFADPTYDITFKMLFGTDKNKEILISLLNNLLNFRGEKEIKAVEINTNELPVIPYSKEKTKLGVVSAVDVLCTTANGQKIAIEMQGQKTKCFLAREQEYMAKLIVGQVKEGEGKQYNEKMLETYIIVITKENVFTGKADFEKQKLFEIDIEPRIVQTNEPYPDNKMHWKFFELTKFRNSENYKKIDKDSSLKEQWLEFLIECNKQKTEPERNEIIKKGYEIMKMSKWDADTQALYWKQKQYIKDVLQDQEELIQETAEKAYKEGESKGIEKGKIKGEVKGEISKVKNFMELEVPQEKFITKLHYLTQEKFKDNLEYNLNYIKDHLAETESVIGDNLHLFDMDIEY